MKKERERRKEKQSKEKKRKNLLETPGTHVRTQKHPAAMECPVLTDRQNVVLQAREPEHFLPPASGVVS